MKLMVTGANGQVGRELGRSLAALGSVTALDRSQCDLSLPSLLPDVVRSLRPDVIVNAAAYTAVDEAEREEALATTVNGTAVGVMAQEVQSLVPEAVVRGRDGCLRVFYDKLGLTFQTYDAWFASGARIPAVTVVAH